MLLAPLTAQLVADAMLDGRIDPALAALSPSDLGICEHPGIPELGLPHPNATGSGSRSPSAPDTGDRFGIECAGASEADAVDRLTRWLEWQSEHTAALEALQRAEHAYHRTIAGSAFASPTEGPSAIELQKESLEQVEAARVRLDEVRARKPE